MIVNVELFSHKFIQLLHCSCEVVRCSWGPMQFYHMVMFVNNCLKCIVIVIHLVVAGIILESLILKWSFPDKVKCPEEREKWINALPNKRETVVDLSEIRACVTHFNCEWQKVHGGNRPVEPPSLFPGIPKSCLKQASSHVRSTSSTFEERDQLEDCSFMCCNHHLLVSISRAD